MSELEIVLHYGLYEAVQESYKDRICEISTHRHGDCVTVHLTLKSGSVLASVGTYQLGMHVDYFYERMIEGLK